MGDDVLTRNRLDKEQSLYLRQHSDQPVHWQPWDEEALAAAKAGGRPIMLSIGYSACHWCHVMARESFADEKIAAMLNENFVNIKVDREERPDLDQIYQMAHMLMLGRGGGWPLTVFMTPDAHRPFFIGTYFPPERSVHLPSFSHVLTELNRVHHEKPEMIQEQSETVARSLHLYFNQPREEDRLPGPEDFFRVQSPGRRIVKRYQ